jgi:AraC-like DNA-binding protein
VEGIERFFTLSEPPDRRLASWKEAACDRLIELDFQIQNRDGFTGSILQRDLAMLSLTQVAAAAHGAKRVTRSRRQVARAAEEFFLISIQLEGACRLYQSGREANLNPDGFMLYDSTRPYELAMDGDYRQITLRIPRRTLASRLAGCEALTAMPVSARTVSARMLLQMVRTLCDDVGSWGSGIAFDIAEGVLGVVMGGLRALRRTNAASGTSNDKQVARIKAYVLAHLGDPGLKVSTIAHAIGLSPSYLHKVFQREATTLDRWIWERRLDACYGLLADPSIGHNITEIALSNGFSDGAHFSRSFRRRFGISPRAHRRAANEQRRKDA